MSELALGQDVEWHLRYEVAQVDKELTDLADRRYELLHDRKALEILLRRNTKPPRSS